MTFCAVHIACGIHDKMNVQVVAVLMNSGQNLIFIFIVGDHDSFVEHYHGREDIPDEQRVFSMPKLPIREQIAAYQEMADRSALSAERPAPRADREDR